MRVMVAAITKLYVCLQLNTKMMMSITTEIMIQLVTMTVMEMVVVLILTMGVSMLGVVAVIVIVMLMLMKLMCRKYVHLSRFISGFLWQASQLSVLTTAGRYAAAHSLELCQLPTRYFWRLPVSAFRSEPFGTSA
jgi:hypothetical protein